MLDWIKWGEFETPEMNYYDAYYIISLIFIIVFLTLASTDSQNTLSHLSIAIGLFGLLIAVYSIQSSTKQLTEMEADYWNARGIDDNRKGAELLERRENDKAALAYKNAIDAFDKAEELDPLYAKSWSNKGNALVAQKKYDEAIEALSHAIELDSNSPRTWTNYGLALYEKGKAFHNQRDFLNSLSKHDEAIRAFDTAKEQDNELSLAWNGMGAALKDKGDIFKSQSNVEGEHYISYANRMFDGAIRCYRRAIELDPNFGSFWFNLGFALNEKGNFDDAVQHMIKLLALIQRTLSFGLAKAKLSKIKESITKHFTLTTKLLSLNPYIQPSGIKEVTF